MDFFSSNWDDKSVSSLQAVLTLAGIAGPDKRSLIRICSVCLGNSEPQIRGGIEDNSKIIFLISQRKYIL